MLQLDIAAAAEARKAKAQWAKENLDLDWPQDIDVWKDLARKYNTRLPSYTQPATATKYCKRMAKKLGFEMAEYLESCGTRTLSELVKMNPNHPSFAFCGFMLEWWDEKQTEGDYKQC